MLLNRIKEYNRMYEATKKERKELKKNNYTEEQIDVMDLASDEIRQGAILDISIVLLVIKYQSLLQEIKKQQKRWWQFWK